ncbi:uracil-DNA glycosylase, partial [candidate division WOR-3 bacterium]|nr:uracil-DNA glycosylase [candidate division WOR-3 bacterium]
IGEAPGYKEDEVGEPFVGKAGQLLTKMLKAIDLTREEIYIANVLKCRPPENRDPKPEEVDACKVYLEKQIELIAPQIILALGRHSLRLLTGYEGTLSQIRGNVLYYEGIKVIPTYHPAALIYHQEWKKGSWEDLKFLRRLYTQIAAD